MEMVFKEPPNSYELTYVLPGQGYLENKNYCENRIHGVGHNYYQQLFYKQMVKRAKTEGSLSAFTDSLDCDEALY